eukprot:3341702-Pyramimonas_sp.AAC.1
MSASSFATRGTWCSSAGTPSGPGAFRCFSCLRAAKTSARQGGVQSTPRTGVTDSRTPLTTASSIGL